MRRGRRRFRAAVRSMRRRLRLAAKRNPRCGITLLEVVIAMAIFVMTLPALNALVLLGVQRAEEAKILAIASLQCRSKMAEIAAGAAPLDGNDWAAIDDSNPNWQWRSEATSPSGISGMKLVQVWVEARYRRRQSDPRTNAHPDGPRPVRSRQHAGSRPVRRGQRQLVLVSSSSSSSAIRSASGRARQRRASGIRPEQAPAPARRRDGAAGPPAAARRGSDWWCGRRRRHAGGGGAAKVAAARAARGAAHDRSSRRPRSGGRAGYTLLEMSLALAIAAHHPRRRLRVPQSPDLAWRNRSRPHRGELAGPGPLRSDGRRRRRPPRRRRTRAGLVDQQ